MIGTYIPYAVAAVLIAATLIDMRTGKIPNWVTYALFGLFIVLVALSPDRSAYGWQLLFAGVAFAIGLLLYAMLGFGAGAVKLLFGAALFMPAEHPFKILGLLLLTMFLGGLFVKLLRGSLGSEDSNWRVLRERVMPMSIPVAATGLIAMFLL